MLEEELGVAPPRVNRVRTGHKPANQSILAAEFWCHVEAEKLEEDAVGRQDRHLVLHVILVFVGPPVHIIRLHVHLVRPVRVLLFVAILIEHTEVHDGGATDVISDRGQVLADGGAGALVIILPQDGRPPVLEEVEGCLAVESEHGKEVARVHAVSVELDSVARGGLTDLWSRLESLRDTHYTVLGTSEHASVGSVRVWNQLNLRVGAHGMGPLYTPKRHRVSDRVVGQVHVLVHETLEALTSEESFTSRVHQDVLPDDFLLALGGQLLIVRCIQLERILGPHTVREALLWAHSKVVRVIVAEVMVGCMRLGNVSKQSELAGTITAFCHLLHQERSVVQVIDIKRALLKSLISALVWFRLVSRLPMNAVSRRLERPVTCKIVFVVTAVKIIIVDIMGFAWAIRYTVIVEMVIFIAIVRNVVVAIIVIMSVIVIIIVIRVDWAIIRVIWAIIRVVRTII